MEETKEVPREGGGVLQGELTRNTDWDVVFSNLELCIIGCFRLGFTL